MNTIRNTLSNSSFEYVILLFLILMVCSCCSTKPTLIEQKECNDKAINAYIQECIPKGVSGKEWDYYFVECSKQAKLKHCEMHKYLIIEGQQVPCDSVPEKYREYCQ